MVVLLVYDDWLLWMFIIIAFDSCFFVIVHTHTCFLLLNFILIAYNHIFVLISSLSIFNFLDISNFLHWVYFRFGSLYFCFGLVVYFFFGCLSMNALVIYKYCFGLAPFGMFSTWLIPLWMIDYYVNDYFYFSAFIFLMLPKGERIM